MKPRPPSSAECPRCGVKQGRDAPECAECGAPFRTLCSCGTEYSVFEEDCPACSMATETASFPLSRRRPFRLAVGAGVVLLLAAIGILVAQPRTPSVWELRETGGDLVAQQRHEEAIAVFRELVATYPTDATGWYMLAFCHRELEFDQDVTVPFLKRAVDLDPELPWALMMMAEYEAGRGRGLEAIELAERATLSPRATAEAYTLLLQLLRANPVPTPGAMFTVLGRAERRGIESPELSLHRAEILMNYHVADGSELPPEIATAIAAAESALPRLGERAGENAIAVARSRLQLAQNDGARALESIERAVATLPADAAPLERALLQALKGEALLRQGRAEGIASFREALRAAADTGLAMRCVGFLRARDRLDTAEALIAEVLVEHPESAGIHAVHASLLLDLGQDRAAQAAVGTAVRLAPEDPRYHLLAGDIHRARRELDEAESAYQRASDLGASGPAATRIALLAVLPERSASRATAVPDGLQALEALRVERPEDPQVLIALGRLQLADGKVDEAVETLEAATRVMPYDTDLHLLLANAARRSTAPGAAALAARALERAGMLAPKSDRVALVEARMHFGAGRLEEAVSTCNAGLEHRPDATALMELRARAYHALGEWEREAEDLRRVVEARPTDVPLRLRLIEAELALEDLEAASRHIDAALPFATGDNALALRVQRARVDADQHAVLVAIEQATSGAAVAWAKLHMGDIDGAIQAARNSFAENPNDQLAALALVRALLARRSTIERNLREAKATLADLGPKVTKGMRLLIATHVQLADGQVAAALESARRCVTLRPSDPRARLMLGLCIAADGDERGAADEYIAVARIPELPGDVRRAVAFALVQAGRRSRDPVRAESLTFEALRLVPASPAALEQASGLLGRRGDYVAAAELAENALRFPRLTDDDRDRLRMRAIMARIAQGKTIIAVEHMKKLSVEARDGALGTALRGFIEVERGELKQAEATFRRVLASGNHPELGALGLIQVAIAARRPGVVEQQIAEWRRGSPEKVGLVLTATVLLHDAGFDDHAARIATGLSTELPGSIRAVNVAVASLARLGRKAEALAAARRFAENAPVSLERTAALYAAQCELKLLGREAEDALALARRVAAETASPVERLDAWALEAEALLQLGRTSDIVNLFTERLSPWPPEGLQRARVIDAERRLTYALGTALLDQGRPTEAAEILARAYELGPDDVGTLNNLAYALTDLVGSARRAVTLAGRATELAPANASCWATLAHAQSAADKGKDAEESWRKALGLYAKSGRDRTESHARCALEFAAFLRTAGREEEARTLVRPILEYAADTPAGDEARAFLDGS